MRTETAVRRSRRGRMGTADGRRRAAPARQRVVTRRHGAAGAEPAEATPSSAADRVVAARRDRNTPSESGVRAGRTTAVTARDMSGPRVEPAASGQPSARASTSRAAGRDPSVKSPSGEAVREVGQHRDERNLRGEPVRAGLSVGGDTEAGDTRAGHRGDVASPTSPAPPRRPAGPATSGPVGQRGGGPAAADPPAVSRPRRARAPDRGCRGRRPVDRCGDLADIRASRFVRAVPRDARHRTALRRSSCRVQPLYAVHRGPHWTACTASGPAVRGTHASRLSNTSSIEARSKSAVDELDSVDSLTVPRSARGPARTDTGRHG